MSLTVAPCWLTTENTTPQLVMTNRESQLAPRAEVPMPRGAESHLFACLYCNQLFVAGKSAAGAGCAGVAFVKAVGYSSAAMGWVCPPDFCIFCAVCWSPPLSMPQPNLLVVGSSCKLLIYVNMVPTVSLWQVH